jgi:hypothetical protein
MLRRRLHGGEGLRADRPRQIARGLRPGECIGVIGGVRMKLHVFCFDMPSDACFIKAYPAETKEAFLDGHVSAFAFFGGVPISILYDNLVRSRNNGIMQLRQIATALFSPNAETTSPPPDMDSLECPML